MNAVEIEQAVSELAEAPFDAAEFPYRFLEAFGNKETTLKRLRKGDSNRSDAGGVLQTGNIHVGNLDWKRINPDIFGSMIQFQQSMLCKTTVAVQAGVAGGLLTPAIGDETADVLSFAQLLAHDLGLDPAELITGELAKNKQRYPVDKSRGRSTKYDKL